MLRLLLALQLLASTGSLHATTVVNVRAVSVSFSLVAH